MEVTLERPEEMNLLGLFMKAALEPRLADEETTRARGDIALTGGEMSVTLSFSPQRVVIRKGVAGKPRAHIKGSLEALIEVARGKTAPLLTRRARLSGNPLAALPLAGIFRKEA
jgi:hypothetical protein